MLTGAREPEAAAWALARDGREVVITLGADGALWSDGEQAIRAAAAEAPAPVDSTGAGDAFTAGWLAARLGGAEPAEALAAANALARAPCAPRALASGLRRRPGGAARQDADAQDPPGFAVEDAAARSASPISVDVRTLGPRAGGRGCRCRGSRRRP